MLHPLSDNDIDKAIQNWNGNIESKHAVVRYMKDHAREKDTAAWLAQEYGGSNSLFVVRAGSPEEMQLTWPKVQRRLAQLIQEDRFYTCLLYTSSFCALFLRKILILPFVHGTAISRVNTLLSAI